MAGSSIVEKLTQYSQKSKLNYEIITRSHKEPDLTDQSKVRDFFDDVNPAQSYNDSMCSHINIGTGKDIEIIEIAKVISESVGFNGEIFLTSLSPMEPQENFEILLK